MRKFTFKTIAQVFVGVALVAAQQPVISGTGVNVTVAITGVRSDEGSLRTALCTSEDSFPSDCKIRKEVKASQGTVKVEFEGVAPGRYAFAVFHDENANGRVDMKNFIFPKEGLAFGKDAMGTRGIPKFEQAAIEIEGESKSVVKMRYMR
ncbi:DUF2141 domain-containing protein [Teredinibacter waterburyi]|uniref:DUF2141 domain-containing protein n=1 Tax=Teredinibacter waterburyi TaxID=1500538 RepID=UPI00165F9089|nr:DUF2141 domain-containing protein [Teredinibacter waterburyi]